MSAWGGGSQSRFVITDETRGWIAQNLLSGNSNFDIASALQQQGCPLPVALAEVQQAAASPYVRGAQTLRDRLGKREWLLSSISRLASLDGGLEAVDTVDRLPAERFFKDYYAGHRPVLISGLMDEWPAMKLWSLDYFEEVLEDPEISVQTRRESDNAYEINAQDHRTPMRLSAVLALLREGRETNDFYVTAGNDSHNRTALARLWDDVGPIPGYLDRESERDGFFWMGPKGTVTPFHHDLTNNLLVQIRGRKKVVLVPSWETYLMRNTRHCFSAFGSPEEIAALPEEQRPALMECVIEPGQALFIPLGWWHHVVGLDMTIGMSFTNFTRDNDFTAGYRFYNQL